MSVEKLIVEPEFFELEDEILEACVPSEEVRVHLKGRLSSIKMAKLVCGAAIPLWQKADFLHYIYDFEYDPKLREILFPIVDDVSDAESKVNLDLEIYRNANDQYVYTLEECWYDYDVSRHKEILVGVFNTLPSAIDYIRASETADWVGCSEEDQEEIWNALCWWELRLWEKTDKSNKDGLKEYGCFYFLHDEAMWFDRTFALLDSGREQEEQDYSKRLGYAFSTHYCHCSEWLKLPLPFAPGTVIEINTYPFGPVSVGILIAYADINDEDVMTLVRNYKGMWQLIDVSSAMVLGRFQEQEDWTSPLYRLKTTEAKSNEDKRIFEIIAAYIDRDQDKGNKLLGILREGDEYADEDIIEIVKRLRL